MSTSGPNRASLPDEVSTGDDEPLDPVERLSAYIRGAGIDAEIVMPSGDAATVALAAAALGEPSSRIIKSLLFESRGGALVLAIACGDSRVDRRRLATAAGTGHLKLATPERVLAVTGFAVGGTPPVGHRCPVPIFVDSAVLNEPVVYGGGGRSDALLRIRPEDILRLTGASVVTLAEADP